VTTDEQHFTRALARITRTMCVIAAAGTAVAWWLGSWRGGLGFLAGAAASGLGYYWLKHVVEALANQRSRRRTAILAGLRYLLLGIGAYVIFRLRVVSLPAALAGLFTAVAAVVVEIVYELAHARK
jgi:hypothetical protein